MEFEITLNLWYTDSSNYKNDVKIWKGTCVGQSVVEEIKRIVADREEATENDNNSSQFNRVGR